MVCWLFIGSFTFSAVLRLPRRHEPIEKFMLAMTCRRPVMVLAQAIIFVLGWRWNGPRSSSFSCRSSCRCEDLQRDPLFFGLLGRAQHPDVVLSPPVAMAPFLPQGVAPAGSTSTTSSAG